MTEDNKIFDHDEKNIEIQEQSENQSQQTTTPDIVSNQADKINSHNSNKDFKTLLKEHKGLIDSHCNKKIYSVEILKYITKNKRNYAVVDCRLKSECLCPVEELPSEHKIGDVIDVMIVSTKIGDYIEVSSSKAKMERKRATFKKYKDHKKSIKCIVKKKVRSGYNVDIEGYPGFLKTENNLDIGSQHSVLIRFIPNITNKSQSHSRIICVEEEQLNLLNKIVTCTIKQMNEFFVFVDVPFGQIREGIIHINDLSNKKITHPMDQFKVGDEIRAAVRRVDPKQLFLSVKYIYNLKMKEFVKKHNVGDIINCTVLRSHANGMDVKINEHVNAFVPRSESAWGVTPSFTEGQDIQAKIIELSLRYRKIILSVKQLSENPLEQFQEKYKIKDKITFKITDKRDFYVLSQIDGVNIRLYDNEFHWIYTQSKKLFDEAQIGDEIKANIYKINPKNCSIYVTRKLPSNSANLKLHKVYQCKIIDVSRSGLIVQILETESTGFISRSHCSKSTSVSLRDFKEDQIVKAELISLSVEKKMPLLSIKSSEIKENKDIIQDYNSVVTTTFTDFL